MASRARYTRMDRGTAEEFHLHERIQREQRALAADHMLAMLKRLVGLSFGHEVDCYRHSLQTATRAFRDGADEELVCVALLHDIGHALAPENHSQIAAAVLRPYLSEQNYWLVAHHGLFLGYYYFHHFGHDRHARERYRGHPHFEPTAYFCARYDQCSFDPHHDCMPIEAFEPMVRRLFECEPVRFA